MAKWKVVFETDGAQDIYEVVSGKTKEEAVRKVIGRERATEYDGWAMQMEPEEEFKPLPESYWTERYERLLASTVEFVPEKRN